MTVPTVQSFHGDQPRPDGCYRYWGSDGTLCAKHHGRFATVLDMRCDRAGAELVAEAVGASIAEAVRRVSNREAFRFVNIDWTALGEALVAEWPRA